MDKGTILTTQSNRYEIGQCLGRGAQGSVYQACRSDGASVAIKLVREVTIDSLQRQGTELRAYRDFPNQFVRLLDWSLTCARPFFVLEFCVHGSARNQLGYLSTWHSVTLPLLAQAAGALEELHRHGYLYRDFKPDNLLLTEYGFGPWVAKLGDAGLICLPRQTRLVQVTQFARGTPEYLAPELFVPGALYTQKAEAFAFGITAVEMLTGSRPAAGTRVSAGPSEIHALLTNLISRDPSMRPTLHRARLQLETASENLRNRNRAIGAVAVLGLVILAGVAFGKNR
jgi:serine/threonine protein kinase